MSVDLLKLDKDCAMPNQLRRYWKDTQHYDPLTRERWARTVGWISLISMLGTFSSLISLPIIGNYTTEQINVVADFLIKITLVLLFVFPVSTLFLALVNYQLRKEGANFAQALEKLSRALNDPVIDLHTRSCGILETLANKQMCNRVRALLEADRAIKTATRETLDDLLGSRACRRQELKDTHAALLAFQLVDEKWDRYFAAVETELKPMPGPAETPSQNQNEEVSDSSAAANRP